MDSFHPSRERINRTEMITPLSSTWRRNFHRNFFHNAPHWPVQCLSTGVFRGAGAGLIMTGDGRYCAGWRGTMPPVVYPVLQGSGRKFRPEGAGRIHERPPVPANGSGQAPVLASLYPGNLVRRRGSLIMLLAVWNGAVTTVRPGQIVAGSDHGSNHQRQPSVLTRGQNGRRHLTRCGASFGSHIRAADGTKCALKNVVQIARTPCPEMETGVVSLLQGFCRVWLSKLPG